MNRDSRLEKVEQITINFETFKKALKRNYLSEDYYRMRQNRSFVLRLYPPFEAEMEADYYESEEGRRYNNEWDEKPFHIRPELLILEGTDRGFRSVINWEEEYTIRDHLSEEEIEEMGGIEACLEESHQMFWDELKTILPSEVDLGQISGQIHSYPVDINWIFEE